MAKEYDTYLEKRLATSLQESKKKKREEEEEEEEEEEDSTESEREQGWSKSNKAAEKYDETDEEEENKGKKRPAAFSSVKEETLAASSLHPGAKKISDPKSKLDMINHVLGAMTHMPKEDLTHWFNTVMAQFGPGKDYGVDDHEASNEASIRMKPSHAVSHKGPTVNMPMPKIGMKEDVEEMFAGSDLSEEFKNKASTLFEAAVHARLIVENARLEEAYQQKIQEELEIFEEQITTKLDTYLDYVVENWMKENEVAIESTLRNEIMEEFMDGLKNLFSEHYINVPENKVDVLEALAQKVSSLEEKLDETISENASLKGSLIEENAKEIFVELASDLALTQQEKFAALAEGIEFDGNLNTYAKKLNIIKENYFRNESTSYSSNIEEETFEGELTESNNRFVDPNVNRYVQAISRNVKK